MQRFFYRHQPKSSLRSVFLAGVGAAIAIAILAFASNSYNAMLMAPLGATCVLVFGFPASPFSQPANVVGGHLLSAALGLAMHFLLPGNLVMDGVVVGLAVSGMMLFRIVHPPAGATALLAYLTATNWIFLVFPVLTGSVVLVVLAFFYHLLLKSAYPNTLPKV